MSPGGAAASPESWKNKTNKQEVKVTLLLVCVADLHPLQEAEIRSSQSQSRAHVTSCFGTESSFLKQKETLGPSVEGRCCECAGVM